MLKHLSISNYAIIDNLELDLEEGFSVITGETGAGKSILLGALSLILGNRADTSVLNNKSKKCIVEGEFLIGESLKDFFSHHDLDYDTASILRREISANGKSRAFINDTPVTLLILKELSGNLIDIHSQSESLLLKTESFQVNALDSFSGSNKELEDYQKIFNEYKLKIKKLNKLKESSTNLNNENEYIQFQINEIEALKIQPNEKEELEEKLSFINNSEEIKNTLNFSSKALLTADDNITLTLREIKSKFLKLSNYSSEYKDIYNRIESIVVELEDLAYTIDSLDNQFDFDEESLTFFNDRLSKIYSIEQKHRLSSTEEILNYLESLKSKLQSFENQDEHIHILNKEIDILYKELLLKGEALSKKRKSFVVKLEESVKEKLKSLGMPKASFSILINALEDPSKYGMDNIQFVFSANQGFSLQPISKVASGGELSRLMLVIKMFLVKGKKLNTIIFDEIDTGVSGEIASKMAEMMLEISKDTQVISITHLPQVAAKGNTHYEIVKDDIGINTYSKINKLSKEERVLEIAKMLSGDKVSEAAIKNANILIQSN